MNKVDINRLPKSWNDVKLKDYVKLISNLPEHSDELPIEGDKELEINILILSMLLDVPVAEIEALQVNELLKMVQRISFMNELPVGAKISLKLKKVEELTYDEFVSYENLKNDSVNNMAKLISIFAVDKSEEQIEEMSIQEVIQAFFILRKNTQRYLNRLQVSLGWKLVKMVMKEKIQKVKMKVLNLM